MIWRSKNLSRSLLIFGIRFFCRLLRAADFHPLCGCPGLRFCIYPSFDGPFANIYAAMRLVLADGS